MEHSDLPRPPYGPSKRTSGEATPEVLRKEISRLWALIRRLRIRNNCLRQKLIRCGHKAKSRGRPVNYSDEELVAKMWRILERAGSRGIPLQQFRAATPADRHRRRAAMAQIPIKRRVGRGGQHILFLAPIEREPNGSEC